jgi:hypothetical protein
MAAPTPFQPQPPPNLSGVKADPALTNYLREFALWAKNSISDKIGGRSAAPGILLEAHDAPAGTIPKVFMLQVTTAGALVVTPVRLGGPNPT